MFVAQEPKPAVLRRSHVAEPCLVTGNLFISLRGDGGEEEKGAFLAVCVTLDSGAEVYALPKQLSVPAEGELVKIRAGEAAAAAEIQALREQMWGGGGRVVYTTGDDD